MSSPGSFKTAQEPKSPISPILDKSRADSNGLVAPASLYPAPGEPFFRPAKDLTHELCNHAAVHFEHSQYLEAITHLTSLLEAGTNISTAERPLPAFVPPPQLLALTATLVVHPSVTTRTLSQDRIRASNAALGYLSKVNRLVGPLNAGFVDALGFISSRDAARRGGNGGGRRRAGDSPDSEDEGVIVKTKIANETSVWAQAEDFWQAVGWAFNCSVMWVKRWERWKMWLGFMLDVMESDWAERMKMAEMVADEEVAVEMLRQSLLYQYLKDADAKSRSSRRRILRAVFSTGSQVDMNEFKEVFVNETAEPAKTEVVKNERKLNIDEGDFGDYESESEEDEVVGQGDFTSTSRSRSRRTRRGASPTGRRRGSDSSIGSGPELANDDQDKPAIEILGGIDALILRQRLLALLVEGAASLKTDFTHFSDLVDLYTEFLRPQKTTIFQAYLTTLRIYPISQIFLYTTLLIPLQATSPSVFRATSGIPSQQEVEEHCLPKPANNNRIRDAAKLSIVLELLLLRLLEAGEVTVTPKLQKSVEEGIRARNEKAVADARKTTRRGLEEEESDRRALNASAIRLRLLVGLSIEDAALRSLRTTTSDSRLTSSPLSSAQSLSFTPSDFDEESADEDDDTLMADD